MQRRLAIYGNTLREDPKMLRQLSILFIAASVGIHAGACNPDKSLQVNIAGLTDEAAAEHIADTLCQHMAVCPQATFECSSTSDGPTVCSGELDYMTYSECYQEIKPDILEDLEQVELTVAQEQLVNNCVNGMIAQDCMTQAELDEIVDAMNRGEEPDLGEDYPAACEEMDQIFGEETDTEPVQG
jgi:hypothetical protein